MLFGGLKFRIAEIFEDLIFIYVPINSFWSKMSGEQLIIWVFEKVDPIVRGSEKSCLT